MASRSVSPFQQPGRANRKLKALTDISSVNARSVEPSIEMIVIVERNQLTQTQVSSYEQGHRNAFHVVTIPRIT